MKQTSSVVICMLAVLLSACSIGGMAGPFPGGSGGSGTPSSSSPPQFKVPPAPSQVVYRIDKNRFFEVIPEDDSRCWGSLFYTDLAKEIHKSVARFGSISARGEFIIDAANTEYLIGPIVVANGNCGADTADMPWCSDRMPYSTDSGKTWKYGTPLLINSSSPIVLTGDQVFYAHSTASVPKLHQGYDAWVRTKQAFPKPRIAPIDTKFHCDPNEEE